MTDEPINTNSWVKLYHPTGALVTIPIDLQKGLTFDDGKLLIASVDSLIAAGFSANMPGLEAGELMEEINAVARREGADMTPIIDFYSSNKFLEKKFMHAYMNTPEDIEAFQQATGILLDTLTTYDGQIAIARTDRNAPKYIRQLATPIKVVFKISPKWETWNAGDKTGQEPHKRLLIRYETGSKPASLKKPDEPDKVTEPGVKMYGTRLDGELVTLIVKKMNVKPSAVTPILAKAQYPISFDAALKLVEDSLAGSQ